MKQRNLAIDLSGPKALAESLIPRSNSAVADAVDSGYDSFSSAVTLGVTFLSERRPSGTWSRAMEVSMFSDETVRDGTKMTTFTYHRVLRRADSVKEWIRKKKTIRPLHWIHFLP